MSFVTHRGLMSEGGRGVEGDYSPCPVRGPKKIVMCLGKYGIMNSVFSLLQYT